MRENPAISDWVPISGGSTKGLLGGWLAQRQAALREVMAAGALSTFTLGLPCVPVCTRACRVPWENFLWKLRVIDSRREWYRTDKYFVAAAAANSFSLGHESIRTDGRKRKNPVIADRVQFRKGLLLGCSAGGWRSGRRRSEM